MANDRGSDPAYPVDVVREYKAAGEGHHRTVVGKKGGLTIREYFTAKVVPPTDNEIVEQLRLMRLWPGTRLSGECDPRGEVSIADWDRAEAWFMVRKADARITALGETEGGSDVA